MAKTADGDEGLDRSPGHLLHKVLQLSLDLYGEALKDAEAAEAAPTQRQYAVLAAVASAEGASQTALVRATGIDRSTLADLVARMMARGWLVRERSSEDARANAVTLTDAGRAALAAAAPRAQAADARLLSLLKPKKRDAFLEALRKLARASDGEAPKAKGAKKDGKKKKKKHAGDKAGDVVPSADPTAGATGPTEAGGHETNHAPPV